MIVILFVLWWLLVFFIDAGPGTAVEENLCKICMDSPIDCVLLDCGHMVTCTKCGKRMNECPICRQYVVRAVHVFRSWTTGSQLTAISQSFPPATDTVENCQVAFNARTVILRHFKQQHIRCADLWAITVLDSVFRFHSLSNFNVCLLGVLKRKLYFWSWDYVTCLLT